MVFPYVPTGIGGISKNHLDWMSRGSRFPLWPRADLNLRVIREESCGDKRRRQSAQNIHLCPVIWAWDGHYQFWVLG